MKIEDLVAARAHLSYAASRNMRIWTRSSTRAFEVTYNKAERKGQSSANVDD